MLTAIHSPIRVRAVVATVPGNVVAGGWPSGGPAWLLDGRPLPYVDHSGPDSENTDAFIPVELVPGPVLLISAGADQVWPSADMTKALSRRLNEHGDPHGHTILEYPKAGHSLGYLLPQLPIELLPQEITDQAADKAGTRRRVAPGRRIHPAARTATTMNAVRPAGIARVTTPVTCSHGTKVTIYNCRNIEHYSSVPRTRRGVAVGELSDAVLCR